MKSKPLLYAAGFNGLGLLAGLLIGSGVLWRSPSPKSPPTVALPQKTPPPSAPENGKSAPPQAPAEESGTASTVHEPPPRKTAELQLHEPPGGSDYDTVELRWVRPLEDEPLASPRVSSEPIALENIDGKSATPQKIRLPTGVYELDLENRKYAERIHECVFVSELNLREGPPEAIALPPSLSRDYAGIGGIVSGQKAGEPPVGFFCGLRLNLKENSGCFLISFQELKEKTVFSYGNLKPRPDTAWPVSNLYLENAGRLSFDCNLNHADYRVTVDAADARVFMVPRYVAPENKEEQENLLDRMKALIAEQVRVRDHGSPSIPAGFDAQFAQRPLEEMPNFKNLNSPEQYQRYLARIAMHPPHAVEIGESVSLTFSPDGQWTPQIKRIFRRRDP